MDPIDREILRLLEQDARISFNDMGKCIGLSKTTCWKRTSELERQRVITGYRAELDPAHLGLGLHAFVQVTVLAARHVEFESAILTHPSVLECYATAGPSDYLLHVLVEGIDELDTLLRSEIWHIPGVERLVTTVGMKMIKKRGLITACASPKA